MARAKKETETTTIVWWENLPQDLIDFMDRQMEEADEMDKRRQEKRAQKKSEKKDGSRPTTGQGPLGDAE